MEELFGWLFDIIGDIFSGIGDFLGEIFGSGAGEAIAGAAAAGATALATGLLISGVIALATITVESIQNALKGRQELIDKGVVNVVVADFLKQADCTIVTLNALNAANKQVGSVKVKGKAVNVTKNQKIALR